MHKYLQLAKLTFQEYFVYRLNFILWRFRQLVFMLTLFFFWLAIYQGRTEFLGYQKAQMLTYTIGVAFLSSIVVASRSADLAGQVRSGELTKIVLAPIDMFCFWLTKDLVDKILNVTFAILEISIVAIIFKFPFYMPQKVYTIIFFLILVSLATLLYFFLSFFISIIAFWTDEIWATRWLFGIVILDFFSGNLFPIDVLPGWLQKLTYLTPFPHLMYYPLKIWLEQVSFGESVRILLICAFWLLVFYKLAIWLWQKGVRNYGAFGG
jgi:ABC-2 type transport system permease protein